MSTPLWYSIFALSIAAFAVIGNAAIIYLIATRKRLRISVNWFVLSLAVADFSVGLSFFPVYCVCDSGFACKNAFMSATVWFELYASIMNLCAMITDRYLVIVWALKYNKLMTKRRRKCWIVLSWFSALVFSFLALSWRYSDTKETKKLLEEVYYIFAIALLYLLPCIVLTMFTGHMLLISQRHSREISLMVAQLNYNRPQDTPMIKIKTRALESHSAQISGAVVAVFVVCYTAVTFCTICSHFPACPTPDRNVYFVKQLFLLTNSALNPVAYSFFKSDIKREVKRLFYHAL